MKSNTQYAEACLSLINLLLTAYGGVALATAARLKWDPSTYVVVRALFPTEYRVLAGALSGCGAALLLLPLLAAAVGATRCARHVRRTALIMYACAMLALCACEAALAALLVARALRWLRSPAATVVLAALDADGWLHKVLRWVLPGVLDQLLEEASEDAPINLYVVVCLGALLALLQAAAVLLAVVQARAARTCSAGAYPLRTKLPV